MSEQSADQEVCPHCAGTGRVSKPSPAEFPIGAKVLWTARWWRYPEGAQGVVVGHSKGGQRVRIEYVVNDYRGVPLTDGTKERAWVTPQKLELRA